MLDAFVSVFSIGRLFVFCDWTLTTWALGKFSASSIL